MDYKKLSEILFPEIKETVLESVTKTLNISSDKVCITKLKEK